MFTGIVEHAGEVARIDVRADGAALEVRAGPLFSDARAGDSVAVNGCCLTVISTSQGTLRFDAVNETLRRTNLGNLRAGDPVNLERPLPASGRFDGHIVQGHVDGTARVESVTNEGNSRRIRFRAGPEILRYVVEKGSVAVDGISLTVAAAGEDWFEVVIVPYTWQVTNLRARVPGDAVNVEVDLVAKYVERLMRYS